MIERIYSEKAPRPVGPYSQAIRAGHFLFISGQLGIDPASGELAGDFEGQVRLALANVGAILEKAGLSWDNVVKTTVYLTDMSLFGRFNEIYSEVLGSGLPARSAVAVKELPKGALVEVEAIAYCPD